MEVNKMECKIFVGNVPFQCDQNEFTECFEKMQGFIKAEIVFKNDMTISRGFGFLTFDTQENAKKIIGNNTIFFKDRQLRFTEYLNHQEPNGCNDCDSNCNNSNNSNNSNEYNNYEECDDYNYHGYGDKNENNYSSHQQKSKVIKKLDIKHKNLLVVKNIITNPTREWLFNVFSQFGKVGRHFIVTDHDTGVQKSCAIVEIIDDIIYETLTKQKEIILQDNHTLEVTKWRFKTQVYNYNQNNQSNQNNQDKQHSQYSQYSQHSHQSKNCFLRKKLFS